MLKSEKILLIFNLKGRDSNFEVNILNFKSCYKWNNYHVL